MAKDRNRLTFFLWTVMNHHKFKAIRPLYLYVGIPIFSNTYMYIIITHILIKKYVSVCVYSVLIMALLEIQSI
jgi:hypothetical protein